MEAEEVIITSEKRPGWVKILFIVVVILVISSAVSLILWAFFYFNRKPVIPDNSELKQEIANLRSDFNAKIALIEAKIASLPSRSDILQEIQLRIAEEVSKITTIEDVNCTRNYIDLQLQQITADIDVRFNSLTVAPKLTIYDEEGDARGAFSGLQFIGSHVTPHDNVCIIANTSKYWIKKTNYMMNTADHYIEIDIDESDANAIFAFDLYLTLSVDLEKYLQCQHYSGIIRIGTNGEAYLANNNVGVVTVSGEFDGNGNDSARTIATKMSVTGNAISIKMTPNLAFQNTSIDISVQYRSFEV